MHKQLLISCNSLFESVPKVSCRKNFGELAFASQGCQYDCEKKETEWLKLSNYRAKNAVGMKLVPMPKAESCWTCCWKTEFFLFIVIDQNQGPSWPFLGELDLKVFKQSLLRFLQHYGSKNVCRVYWKYIPLSIRNIYLCEVWKWTVSPWGESKAVKGNVGWGPISMNPVSLKLHNVYYAPFQQRCSELILIYYF